MPARILRLTERFNWAVRRHGVSSGSLAGRALFAMLKAMLIAELPGPQDAETLMPPVMRYWFRRVPGHNLWVFFSFNEHEFIAVSLTKVPPVPLLDDTPED